METKNLVFDQSSEGQIVEQIGKGLPNIGVVILTDALVVEAVKLCHLATFVIASQDSEAVRVAALEGDEQSHRFHGIKPTVNVVTHEQIIGIGQAPSNLEQLNQVMKLAWKVRRTFVTVDISANCNWSSNRLNIGLIL
jgi:hypothetical protein